MTLPFSPEYLQHYTPSNEMKVRAVAFTKEWEHQTSEDAEAKSFPNGFFRI